MMRNEPDANDIAHDTMIKVMTSLHRYNPSWAFSTWVGRIARNTAIDVLRKRKKLSGKEPRDTPSEDALPDDIVLRKEQAKLVHRLLGEMPPMYREVLTMHHFQELKYKEIANSLDLPIGTVMNRIHRARNKFRAQYEKAAA